MIKVNFYISKRVISKEIYNFFLENGFMEKRKGFSLMLEIDEKKNVLIPKEFERFLSKSAVSLEACEMREKEETIVICGIKGGPLQPFRKSRSGEIRWFSKPCFSRIALCNYEDLLNIRTFILRKKSGKYYIEEELLYEGELPLPPDLFRYNDAVNILIDKRINPVCSFCRECV